MKKRLLFLASRSPVPAVSGEKLKNLSLIKILSKHYDVHFVCLNNRALSQEEEQELKAFVKSIEVVVQPSWRRILRLISSLWNGKPLQINYFYSSKLQKIVNEKAKQCDLLVCTLVRTAEYAKEVSLPKVLDMGDSIAQNYLQSMRVTTNLFWKMIYFFEGQRLWNYENGILSLFATSFLFNRNEIEKFYDRKKLSWVPHGVKDFLFSNPVVERPKKLQEICFLGKMDYQPNVDAVLWFVEKVLPLLPQTFRLVVMGAQPAESIKKLPVAFPERVEVTGFMEDPYARMRDCGVVVAPMQTGAGIQNKVLEAMALGKAVVCTARGASALEGVQSGRDLWIVDDPEEMAKKIQELVNDPMAAFKMAKAGREYISANFTWQAFEKVWIQTLSSLT